MQRIEHPRVQKFSSAVLQGGIIRELRPAVCPQPDAAGAKNLFFSQSVLDFGCDNPTWIPGSNYDKAAVGSAGGVFLVRDRSIRARE